MIKILIYCSNIFIVKQQYENRQKTSKNTDGYNLN